MLYIEIIKVRDLDVLPNARYTQSHGKWAEKDRNFAVTLTIEPVFMRVTREGVKITDEPTGNVDQETAGEIMDIFVQMHQLKKTVVIVTHDMDVAMKCENVIKLSDGMICES